MSEDMSPYCSAHDEWLIMKLCMYVGFHDANNVSNFGGDPVTQLNFKTFYSINYAVLRTRRSIAVTQSRAGCWSMEDHTSLSTALVHASYMANRVHIGIILVVHLGPVKQRKVIWF